MAESSGLWTTDAAPAGHQQVSYTQALASTLVEVGAACSGFEGVAPGYLSELAPSSTGVNNARIATGGAVVDGKYYKSTANEDHVIANAAAGETRIDRIVLRATWANFECIQTIIAGTSDPTPTAPAITQNTGVTYDIQICQVLVTDGGVITITDERTWASRSVTNRQGGAADSWQTAGTTNYIPINPQIQVGSSTWAGAGATSGLLAVDYPRYFAEFPLLIVSTRAIDDTSTWVTWETATSATGFSINWYSGDDQAGLAFTWIAIGEML